MTSLTKTQDLNFFFIADSKTCWAFWGLEQLFSTIGWGAMWLVKQLIYAWF